MTQKQEILSKEAVLEIWKNYCEFAKDVGIQAIENMYPRVPLSPPKMMDMISRIMESDFESKIKKSSRAN